MADSVTRGRAGTVMSFPARSTRAANPYNYLLAEALEAEGWRVVEPGLATALTAHADIVHVHWPQAPLNQKALVAVRRLVAMTLVYGVQRLRGAKLVWTVHNVRSHEAKRPRAEGWYMRLFVRLLSGAIFLEESVRADAVARWPRLARLPCCADRHLLYGDAYPPADPARSPAFAALADTPVPIVAFVGDLKEYKGLRRFLQAVRGIAPGRVQTLIAGRFRDQRFAADMRAAIAQAQDEGHAITLREGRLDDQEMVDALAVADVLVLPYVTESNSGLAILAAERGVPMLLSDSAVFRHLKAELASDLIETTPVGIEPRQLERLAVRARASGRIVPPAAFLTTRSAVASAARTSRFFQALRGGGSG